MIRVPVKLISGQQPLSGELVLRCMMWDLRWEEDKRSQICITQVTVTFHWKLRSSIDSANVKPAYNTINSIRLGNSHDCHNTLCSRKCSAYNHRFLTVHSHARLTPSLLHSHTVFLPLCPQQQNKEAHVSYTWSAACVNSLDTQYKKCL